MLKALSFWVLWLFKLFSILSLLLIKLKLFKTELKLLLIFLTVYKLFTLFTNLFLSLALFISFLFASTDCLPNWLGLGLIDCLFIELLFANLCLNKLFWGGKSFLTLKFLGLFDWVWLYLASKLICLFIFWNKFWEDIFSWKKLQEVVNLGAKSVFGASMRVNLGSCLSIGWLFIFFESFEINSIILFLLFKIFWLFVWLCLISLIFFSTCFSWIYFVLLKLILFELWRSLENLILFLFVIFFEFFELILILTFLQIL